MEVRVVPHKNTPFLLASCLQRKGAMGSMRLWVAAVLLLGGCQEGLITDRAELSAASDSGSMSLPQGDTGSSVLTDQDARPSDSPDAGSDVSVDPIRDSGPADVPGVDSGAFDSGPGVVPGLDSGSPDAGAAPGSSTRGVRTVFKGGFSNTPDRVEYVANVSDLRVVFAGPSKLEAIHSANPAATLYVYDKIGGLHGPDGVAPAGDRGWDEVLAQDLLWDGPSGAPVFQTQNDWFWVDIITPSKRAAWVNILVDNIEYQFTQGYDGVFLDNACVIDRTLINEYPSNYTDSAYYAAVQDILRQLRTRLPGRSIIINSYTGGAASGLRGMELLQYVDGMFFENFSHKESGRFFEPARYEQQLSDFIAVTALGKAAVGMDYVPTTDTNRRIWSIATYMLGNSNHAFHYLAGTNVSDELQEYPEDALDLGDAVAEAEHQTDGLWVRAYEDGLVVTNPTDHTVTLSLAGDSSWQNMSLSGGGSYPSDGSLSWSAVGTSVSLASNTARILRRAP